MNRPTIIPEKEPKQYTTSSIVAIFRRFNQEVENYILQRSNHTKFRKKNLIHSWFFVTWWLFCCLIFSKKIIYQLVVFREWIRATWCTSYFKFRFYFFTNLIFYSFSKYGKVFQLKSLWRKLDMFWTTDYYFYTFENSLVERITEVFFSRRLASVLPS